MVNPLLKALSWPYGAVVLLRNWCYDRRIFKTHRLPAVIISVGNLSAGGTGKTPVTLALAQLLKSPPYACKLAILSRGYRRKSKGFQWVSSGAEPLCDWEASGDEPQIFARRLPGVPVAVDADRVRGGAALIKEFSPQIMLLDDGFQHRRLARDLDIVLIDPQRDLTDHLLPRGLLREPVSSLKRAHLLFLMAQEPESPAFGESWKYCASHYGEDRLIACRSKRSRCYEARSGKEIEMESLSGARLLPFCGIAKPENFVLTLGQLGAEIPLVIRFRDHHVYDLRDVERMATVYAKHKANYLITTEKDAVKLGGLFHALPILVLQTEIEWLRGFENLQRELNRILAPSGEKNA
ncbi:MAG TPA: tetraacyldisaccharide 4'-kinase [bacterium]